MTSVSFGSLCRRGIDINPLILFRFGNRNRQLGKSQNIVAIRIDALILGD